MKKLLIICLLLLIAVSSFANGKSEKKAKTAKSEQIEKEIQPKVTGKKSGTGQAKSQATVQVLLPISENLSNTESAWLPGQIQDKLKANMQEYLGVRTVVDSNAEKSLKRLQAESESGARDANTAIELGKITTAKYGLFSKIRKTGYGYSLSVDYTDLTTGEQIASATSKEYSKAEYLYGSTGAVDEVTLALANKLDITLNDLTRNLLSSGSADFSVDAQMALAKQNEEHYQKLMNQYDDELKRLSASSDLSSVENKKKIEAEKALLAEKQLSEKKRLAELAEQKQQAESDAKLEAERSVELKTQRDNLAKQAAAKAAEVRKLKLDKQGVLGQITVIESKKKALLDIRESVKQRCFELLLQMREDKKAEENKIRNASWSTAEIENGLPTKAAFQRREKMIAESNQKKERKFITDCENVRKAAGSQDASLLSEIRSDSSILSVPRTVNSLGDELKVSYGTYSGTQAGWNTFLSLYSDGVSIYTGQCVIDYKALTGKSAPDIATASTAEYEEYISNTDMYNSLLTRGEQILYYELDYRVKAENDNKPSQYVFSFDTLHVFNTVTGKEVQSIKLGNNIIKTMTPVKDLRKNINNDWVSKTIAEENRLQTMLKQIEVEKYIKYDSSLYKMVMGNGFDKGSLFDAFYFCNKLSIIQGFEPYYSVDGITDPTKWNYTPNSCESIKGKINEKKEADGYRLPTYDECNNESMFGSFIDRVSAGKWFYPPTGKYNCYSIRVDNSAYSDPYYNNYAPWIYGQISATADTYRDQEDVDKTMLEFDFVRNKIKTSTQNNSFNPVKQGLLPSKKTKYNHDNPALYREIMETKTDKATFYDAIYFCNKLSVIQGFEPVYLVNRESDITKWNYFPNAFEAFEGKISINKNANGYRLPTLSEVKESAYETDEDKWFADNYETLGRTFSYYYIISPPADLHTSTKNPKEFKAGFDFVRNKMD